MRNVKNITFLILFWIGLHDGLAMDLDGDGHGIESVSACSLDVAQERFKVLGDEYESYVEERQAVSEYRKDGNERQYSLLKHYYSFSYMYELFSSPHYEYFKAVHCDEKRRRFLVRSLGENSAQFAEEDFLEANRFWAKYNEVMLSIQAGIIAQTEKFETANQIPARMMEQAKVDAKYGMLLEMIYGPYIALQTGEYP